MPKIRPKAITHARVFELVTYDPQTGEFKWREPYPKRMLADGAVGSITANGRWEISLDNERVYGHRLAWFYVKGEWPKDGISPVNGDYLDLRFENLIENSAMRIARKGPARKTSKSGIKGVSWDSGKQKWLARMTRDYKVIHIGRFETKEEAAAAYSKAEADYDAVSGISVDVEARACKAEFLAMRARQRILWKNTLKLAGGVTGWESFEDFCKDVGTVPVGVKNELRATDQSKPIGPDNFAWHEVVKKFDHASAVGRAAYAKSRRKTHRNLYRNGELKAKFGITLEDYQQMLDAQGGVCAICKQPETAVSRRGETAFLAVDHCHATLGLRDLLCSNCNRGVGSFGDDPARLRAGADYIERHAAMAAKTKIPATENVVEFKIKRR